MQSTACCLQKLEAQPMSPTVYKSGLAFQMYLKLKQLVTLFLWFEVLNGLQQNVNGLCVGDALEARLGHMLQPVLDLRV